MKKINTYIALIIVTLLFSCSEDFLELSDQNRVSEENFWKTQMDAEVGINGCYATLQPDSYFGFDIYAFTEAHSDNAFAGGDNTSNFQIADFNIQTTNSVLDRFFKQVYVGIGIANTAIERIGLMDEGVFEEGKKQAFLGEAHFLRGLHYFHLVQLFGEVPLRVNEVTSLDPEVTSIPRSTEAEVYNQIIEDLEQAIMFLEGKDQQGGRASIGAAEALLAKVNLVLKNYDEVVRLTGSAMTRGFSLLPNYDDLFNQENKLNNEILFAVQYAGLEEGNVFPELVLPTPEASFDFTKFNTPTPNSLAQFEAGDTRRATTAIERNGIQFPFKWRNGTAFQSADHNIVLRYADVLLMRAEALNLSTLSTGTTDAIALLDEIRDRANLSPYSGSTTDKAAVDAAIFQERRVELMYEGHRWFDLKRKGFEFAQAAIQAAKGFAISEFDMLLPIPQDARNRNNKLSQNDGY